MIQRLKKFLFKKRFQSHDYWETRYANGGTSGSGSYGHLAEFKARVLNQFVLTHNITRIIEFGCGDGNQLKLATYPQYIGLDVSPSIIKQCIERFKLDQSKSFFLYEPECFSDFLGVFRCEVSLSLDVIYHLVEYEVYKNYLLHLFNSSEKFVIIYSSNENIPRASEYSHELHREFSKDVEKLLPGWSLVDTIQNEFKSKSYGDESGSLASFYIYKKSGI